MDIYSSLSDEYGIPRNLVKTLCTCIMYSANASHDDLLARCRRVLDAYVSMAKSKEFLRVSAKDHTSSDPGPGKDWLL